MDADEPKPQPPSLVGAVQATANALQLGPADAGLLALALVLAHSIDDMDPEVRARMIGQTAGSLRGVLAELAKGRARPQSTGSSELDELRARERARLSSFEQRRERVRAQREGRQPPFREPGEPPQSYAGGLYTA